MCLARPNMLDATFVLAVERMKDPGTCSHAIFKSQVIFFGIYRISKLFFCLREDFQTSQMGKMKQSKGGGYRIEKKRESCYKPVFGLLY